MSYTNWLIKFNKKKKKGKFKFENDENCIYIKNLILAFYI